MPFMRQHWGSVPARVALIGMTGNHDPGRYGARPLPEMSSPSLSEYGLGECYVVIWRRWNARIASAKKISPATSRMPT